MRKLKGSVPPEGESHASQPRALLLRKAPPSCRETPDGAQAEPTAAHKDGGLHAASAVTLAASASEPTAGTAVSRADATGQQLAAGRSPDGSPGTAAALAETPVSASNNGAAPQVSATPTPQSAHASDGRQGHQRQSQERRQGDADAQSPAVADATASGGGAAVAKHKYVDVITNGEQFRLQHAFFVRRPILP